MMQGLARYLAKATKRAPRRNYYLVSIWSFYFAMEVAAGPRPSFPYWMYVLIGSAYAVILPVATIARLGDLRWSRWWTAAFIAPWIAFLSLARWGSKGAEVAALCVLLVTQLPLLLLKSRTDFIEGNVGAPARTHPE